MERYKYKKNIFINIYFSLRERENKNFIYLYIKFYKKKK